MLKIAFHPEYIHPVREGHRFPMQKYELIPMQLCYEGVAQEYHFFQPSMADPQVIQLAHDPQYVRQMLDLQLDARMVRRIGFPLQQSLVNRERYLVQGTIDGALYAQRFGVAFNVAGGTHHAGYDFGEGFCLLNDQAIAARYLLQQQLASRILIIDLDVHQGNGTAHIFQNDPQVFTFSMHGEKNYPFLKEKSSLDVGLSDQTEDEVYLRLLRQNLEWIATQFKPDFVFFQAGVDVLSTDKLGKMKLTPQGCQMRDQIVFEWCHSRQIPVQVSMGGGYSVLLKDIVNAHCQTFKTAVDIYNLYE